MPHSRTRRTRFLTLLAATALAITACGGGGSSGGTGGGGSGGSLAPISLGGATFKVGSKEFTEQLILGQIATQALKAAGANAGEPISIQGTTNVRAALTSGAIDMYWEYTGTGWTVHLKQEASAAPKGSDALYQQVAKDDKEQNKIIWLPPAPANNTYAIATAQGRGQELNATNLTGYAELVKSRPQDAKLCGAAEFLTRDDGLPGLEKAYGFDLPQGNTVEVDLGVIYTQIPTGEQCKFGEVFATDGRIAANKLEIVTDDKNFFVPYNVAMTVRQDVLRQEPEAGRGVRADLGEAHHRGAARR